MCESEGNGAEVVKIPKQGEIPWDNENYDLKEGMAHLLPPPVLVVSVETVPSETPGEDGDSLVSP